MSYKPTEVQINAAKTLLIDNDHEIVNIVVSEECGYQIETKHRQSKKNPTYRIENGMLKKFETGSGLWKWVNYKTLPLQKSKEDFIDEGYQLLDGIKNSR